MLRPARPFALALLGAPLLGGLAVACSGSPATEDSEQAVRPEPDASERYPGGDTTNDLLLGSSAFKKPATNATREHERAFFTGNSFFNSAWVQAPSSTTARDGLGPLFNARSCSGCHLEDGRGRPPEAPDEDFLGVLLRIGTGQRAASGAPEGDANYGDQLQNFALEGVPVEGTPRVTYRTEPGEYPDGTAYELLVPTYSIEEPGYGAFDPDLAISPRAAPIMVGLGLLEAITEDDVLSRADEHDQDDDGISGRPSWVLDPESGERVLGRFGWKAEQPTVRAQTAGAFLGDLGLSTPVHAGTSCTSVELECSERANGGEPEVEPDTFDKVVIYSRLLAVPVRENVEDETVVQGWHLFRQVGCDGCHVPGYTTGPSDLEEVAEQRIWPYTDLLLHDLGDALGDGRPSFEAEGNEWRTPPLWGIGRIPDVNGHDRLLHDGRARGVEEAILWHGGEAEESQQDFVALDADERNALVRFVESL